jgi:carboxyl-terminal processing protease
MKTKCTIQVLAGVIAALALSACEKVFYPEPGGDQEAIFEEFWQFFKDDYALFEERQVDWGSAYGQYRPLVNANTSASELYGIFSRMIAPIGDGHVALAAPGLGVFDANIYFRERLEDELFDPGLIRAAYLEDGYKTQGKHYVYGQIKGKEIGYIHFDVFRPESVMLIELLRDYPDVKGYIIDLRHNNGGDVSHSFPFLGRFTPERHWFLRSKTKNGKGPDDFTSWHYWYLERAGNFIAKPLVLLTDRYTVSAAERMVMAAKTLPGATIIGDTTNGTFGTKISRELVNGWYFSYSIQKVEMYDGKSYEGIGIPPDILVKNRLEELEQGIDRTLQRAIEWLE